MLVGFAGLLLFLATFAVWVDRVALDTEVFADTSAELIESEEIRRAIASTAVDEIYDSVDVEEELKGPLPENVESLAGPTSAGIRHIAPGIVERALEQPRLQRLWRESVARSHAAFVAVLEERSGTVSTDEGVVTLDLGEIVRESADRIGVSEQVEERIGEDAGEFVILRSDELDTAQDAFRLMNAIAWLLPLLTVALFVLAIWLSRGRRRLTVRAIGIAVLVSGVLGLLAANVVGVVPRRRARRPTASRARPARARGTSSPSSSAGRSACRSSSACSSCWRPGSPGPARARSRSGGRWPPFSGSAATRTARSPSSRSSSWRRVASTTSRGSSASSSSSGCSSPGSSGPGGRRCASSPTFPRRRSSAVRGSGSRRPARGGRRPPAHPRRLRSRTT